jgi:hypothetical protein
MRFSTATIVAFIGMSNALPAPHYGSDATPLAATTSSCTEGGSVPIATATMPYQDSQSIQPTASAGLGGGDELKVPDSATVPVPDSDYSGVGGGATQVPSGGVAIPTGSGSPLVPDASVQPSAPAAAQPSGGLGVGGGAQPSGGLSIGGGAQPSGGLNIGGGGQPSGGLDLGGLVGGLLGGGKLPDLDMGAGGGLNLDGVISGLKGLLDGSGNLEGSGQLDLGGLLDGLKGALSGLPGGKELGTFCDQLTAALSGSGDIDLDGLVSGLEGLLSGSGKPERWAQTPP